jgi:hypothetical protein
MWCWVRFVGVVGLGGEPGRQDGKEFADGEVVAGGHAGQVGDERLCGDWRDSPRQHWGACGRVDTWAGNLDWLPRSRLLGGRLQVAARRQPAQVELPVERGATSLEAEFDDLVEQGAGPQVGVLGEALAAVADEGVGEQAGLRCSMAGCPASVQVVADGWLAVAEVFGDGAHRPSGLAQGEDLLGSVSGQHGH